jgi:hypothetical protein
LTRVSRNCRNQNGRERCGPIDETKIYARKAEGGAGAVSAYTVAEPASVATADRLLFYDLDYRPTLRLMVDHVVEREAPIYFEVLVDRISRAHGFQPAKDMIRGIIKAALASRYPITSDDDREIIWPLGADPTILPPYRISDHREHGDLPLPELATLAGWLTSCAPAASTTKKWCARCRNISALAGWRYRHAHNLRRRRIYEDSMTYKHLLNRPHLASHRLQLDTRLGIGNKMASDFSSSMPPRIRRHRHYALE